MLHNENINNIITIIYLIPTHAQLLYTLKINPWPDFTRTGTPGTHAHTYTQTDDNDIWRHGVQEHNEHTSTEFNLVMA